ncbi:GntR family transcriptional regulator [Paludibacterium yongneupense]|uniref:GntR family transcriptional regulator n=1 Tax=Paludibacterium yongneupense TaxID=400061 RepID=UPI000417C97B|nr:GntR family transcriptional regulator [Paludibacterium yongneupense]
MTLHLIRKRANERAEDALLAMLESPEFAPGDRIPAERDLAQQLDISRMTLRKAIARLVEQGALRRDGNRGTFVARPEVSRPLSEHKARGVSSIVELNGGQAGSRLLYFEQTTASPRLARALDIADGDALLAIRRLRTVDGKPFCVETSYLPAARVPGLVAADLIESGSLYRLLESRYRLTPGCDEGTLQSVELSSEDAALLELPPGASALAYRGVVFDSTGIPLEYVVSVNHPQRVVFTLSNRKLSIQA